MLNALAACLMAGVGNITSARGILGIDASVRNGFRDIKVVFEVDGDAPAEKLATLVEQSRQRSAVFDVLSHGTQVSVEVAAR